MKRIDSINARPDVNGVGKTGFHDNADLSGQDATYVTPDWLNHIQEELANILEKNGVALDYNDREQLFQLLATKVDIDDLATASQDSIDNLASNVNESLNNKYDKTGGTITGDALITGTLTVQTSLFLGSFTATPNGYTHLPNGFLMQFGFIPYSDMTPISGSATGERIFNLMFPIGFPHQCASVTTTVCIERSGGNLDDGNDTWAQVGSVTSTGAAVFNQTGSANSGKQQPIKGIYWQAFGY